MSKVLSTKTSLFFAFIFISFHFSAAYSQSKLTGIVKNTEGTAVTHATVLLKEGDRIISYTRTNNLGLFELKQTKSDASASLIEVNHMGYQKLQQPVVAGQYEYNLFMSPLSNKIEEVFVGKAVPIRQRKDTLSFRVSSFSDSIDRSIGDVLSRMPGFKISEGGKISYNGQDISHFFIDGDDVMGNRYGLGTKVIPYNIVRNVEVYRNYQNIKALADKVASNSIAINLKLENDLKIQWMGEGTLGLGTPKQYLLETNTLLFSKRFKTVNALLSNNTGKNAEIGLKELISEDMNELLSPFVLTSGMKSATTAPLSDFYANRSLGVFSNMYFKAKGAWDFRINLGFFADKRLLNSFTEQNYYLSNALIQNTESIALTHKPLKFNVDFNIVRNLKQHYIANSFKLDWAHHRIGDSLSFSANKLQENLDQQSVNFRHQFNFIPNTKGENIWQLNWKNHYKYRPENLLIQSMAELPIFQPESVHYVKQDLSVKKIGSELNLSYLIGKSGYFKHSYGFEGLFNQERLLSNLYQGDWASTATAENHLDWSMKNAKIFGTFEYKRNKIIATAKLPVGMQEINYRDSNFDRKEYKKRLLFAPHLTTKYTMNNRHSLWASYVADQQFGQITDIYRDYILTDFRTLNLFSSMLPYTFLHSFNTSYQVENSVKMMFLRLSYHLYSGSRNILSSLYLDQDVINRRYTDFKNKFNQQELSLNLSKFLMKLGGTSSLNLRYTLDRSDQILNDKLMQFPTYQITVNPETRGKLLNIQWHYSGAWSWSWADVRSEELPSEGNVQSHRLSLSHSNKSKLFTTIQGYLLIADNKSNHSQQVLLNSSIRYKFSKRIEYALDVANILNEQENNLFLLSSGYSQYQTNRIIGRVVLLKSTFNF